MTAYDKPAVSIDEHLAILQKRGLAIPDDRRARHYLANISYFRLSAYTRPFYRPQQSEHHFRDGVGFDDVLDLYVFDRELRLLLLDAIERIEVALRAQLSNALAENHGPHGYLDASIFDTRYNHPWLIGKLEEKAAERHVELFLEHYLNKYTASPKQPPIWMVVELLTFKEVSTLFANLRQKDDITRIEEHFGWRHTLLKSWFRSLSDLRNQCAHHSRIWNREFGSRPEMPRKPPKWWPEIPEAIATGAYKQPEQTLSPRRRLYIQLVVIDSLMRIVCPESCWAERLILLLDRYPKVSRPHMGFPAGWEKEAFWAETLANARKGAA